MDRLNWVLFFFVVLVFRYHAAQEQQQQQLQDQPQQQQEQPQQQQEQPQQRQEQMQQQQENQHRSEELHVSKDSRSDTMNFGNNVHHIKDHLKTQYGISDEQAEDYMKQYDAQTQFFAMHDYDNNTKLDGLELLKSMTHYHDEEGEDHQATEEKDEDSLVEFVDMILKDQDYNGDGYIDLVEYMSYHSQNDDKGGNIPNDGEK